VDAMTPGERALREDVAVVERVPRAFFTVTGERPLGYLHDVLAQDVAELASGRGALAALLAANGRVAAEVRVIPLDDGEVLLDAEEAARDGIATHVARHAPLAGCEVSDLGFELAAIRGPNTDTTLASTGLPVPDPAEAAFERAGDVLVVRVVWGGPGVDLMGPVEAVRGAVSALRAERATPEDLEAARIEAGRLRFGIDVNDDMLVNETPLLEHGVSLTKGCYPGQESVARVNNLGRVRRALRGLRSARTIAAGDEVRVNGEAVGRVTSAAAAKSGGSFGIALLRDVAAIGGTVEVADTDAVVTELP